MQKTLELYLTNSTPSSVSNVSSIGSSNEFARADHTHQGVSSFVINSNKLMGDVTFSSGTNVLLSQLENSISFSSARIKYILADQKSSGTVGGTYSKVGWTIRTLNTVIFASDTTNCTLNSSTNVFTLQPGTWAIIATSPGFQIGPFKIRLYNVTNSTIDAYGSSAYSPPGGSINNNESILNTIITISSPISYRIEIYGQTVNNSSNALGVPSGIGGGTMEIYTQILLEKTA